MRHPAMHRRLRIPLSATMTAYADACRARGAASMSSASGTASRATLGGRSGSFCSSRYTASGSGNAPRSRTRHMASSTWAFHGRHMSSAFTKSSARCWPVGSSKTAPSSALSAPTPRSHMHLI